MYNGSSCNSLFSNKSEKELVIALYFNPLVRISTNYAPLVLSTFRLSRDYRGHSLKLYGESLNIHLNKFIKD